MLFCRYVFLLKNYKISLYPTHDKPFKIDKNTLIN